LPTPAADATAVPFMNQSCQLASTVGKVFVDAGV
jgi:hypothetical protein